MFRFKQDAGGRMPTMAVMPSPEDLQFLLAQAQKNWRRPVELSFKTAGGTQLFKVSVQCDMTSGDPLWTLTKTTPAGSQAVWTQTSPDVGLIHDLIEIEFRRATTDEQGAKEAAENGPAANSASSAPAGHAAKKVDRATEDVEALDAEAMAIQGVVRLLCRPETGLYTYPAFLFFVDQEYRRFRRGGLPFSVAIFQMNFREPTGRVSSQPMPVQAVTEAALRICKAKRDLDLLAHYSTFDYAFLLPHTDRDGAAILIKRIANALTAEPLMPNMSADRLAVYFGIANMPADADRPRALVTAALEAHKYALNGADNIVLYRDARRF